MTINFTVTDEEKEGIEKIASRALRFIEENSADLAPWVRKLTRTEIEMDITAAHCNGCRLDLTKFLNFPASDFGHDLFGIGRYLDRDTGELLECFVPRCAL